MNDEPTKDQMVDENQNLIDDTEEATIGMSEIDSFDFDRAMSLMAVIKEVANTAPKASSISGLAQAALNEMNEEAKAIGRRRSDELTNLERQRKLAVEEQNRKATEEAAAVEPTDPPISQQTGLRAQPVARPAPQQPTSADNARRI